MFDLIPLRRSRRIVENVQGKPGLGGEFLKLQLPQPYALEPPQSAVIVSSRALG